MPLAGRYCSACGQKADVRILSLGRLLADALGDLLNYDARIWRSLRTLVFRPGHLTRAFIEGRRARYTPPFRMYVVATLAFFVVFSLVRALSPPAEPSVSGAVAASTSEPATAADAEAGELAQEVEPDPGTQQLGITFDDDDLECQVDQKLSPAIRERLEEACRRVEEDNGALFRRAFRENFPVTMLVFIPIVAGIMKLLYLFARRKYVEHLLFFLHVHTFFFVLALASVLLSGALRFLWPGTSIPALIVTSAASLYFFVYLYRAMREVYRQGHALTAAKYVALGGSYLMAAILTLFGAALFTALTV
jgi:hypothetical protein